MVVGDGLEVAVRYVSVWVKENGVNVYVGAVYEAVQEVCGVGPSTEMYTCCAVTLEASAPSSEVKVFLVSILRRWLNSKG